MPVAPAKRQHQERANPQAASQSSSNMELGNVRGDKSTFENQIEQANDSPKTLQPKLQNMPLTLADINPIAPLFTVLRRHNNLAILFPSALMFAFSYSISFTCSRTFSSPPYSYDALQVGMVLLSFGLGNMAGSVFGGRYSDWKMNSSGKRSPEMRLESTKVVMILLPASVVAYAWLCAKHVHVAWVVVMLFFAGFSSIWIYSSTLAYIVDANAGRSSTAVATNSAFRGAAGFVASELAIPLQNSFGDGGLYTLWAGLLVIMELLVLLVIWKGGKWRERAETRERRGQPNEK